MLEFDPQNEAIDEAAALPLATLGQRLLFEIGKKPDDQGPGGTPNRTNYPPILPPQFAGPHRSLRGHEHSDLSGPFGGPDTSDDSRPLVITVMTTHGLNSTSTQRYFGPLVCKPAAPDRFIEQLGTIAFSRVRSP